MVPQSAPAVSCVVLKLQNVLIDICFYFEVCKLLYVVMYLKKQSGCISDNITRTKCSLKIFIYFFYFI